jgi:hypothetical protein
VQNNPVNRVDPFGETVIAPTSPLFLILLGLAAAAFAVIVSQRTTSPWGVAGPTIYWQSSEGQTCPVAQGAEKSVDDVIGEAKPEKTGKSKQYAKPGGLSEANKDFDAVIRGNTPVKDQGEGIRTAEFPDGTKLTVRPKSTEGSPTLEIRPPRGSTVKIRYR